MNADKRNLNSTVLNAVEVLELFEDTEELSVSAIAERMDMPLSTTHRLLSTLVYTGMMNQNPDTGRYRLGIKCYLLGMRVPLTAQLRDASINPMTELSKRYGEVVNVVTHDGAGHVIPVAKAKARNSSFSPLGSFEDTRELQVTSCGKCLLAYMSPQDLENTISQLSFARYTENSIVTPRQLKEELEQIRQQGYAREDEEGERGRYCCGAPIFIGDTCVAAISISMPTVRKTMPEEELARNLKRAARSIEAAMLKLRDVPVAVE